MYCTKCGKAMNFQGSSTETVYDRDTGHPETFKTEIYQCEDYSEGFSDRWYHLHDRVVRTEKYVQGNGGDWWLKVNETS